jgi:hypothetical protein
MRATRAIYVCAVLLTVASPYLAFAEPARPSYTTLLVEFVGEMNRYVSPVVISTSPKEGKWYEQHLFSEPFQFPVYVEVVPTSVLNEITELPSLRRALQKAKPVDDKPKSRNNVEFTAGVGHRHAQILVDAETSTKILNDILRMVDKYPDLKSELKEIDDHVRP